MTEIDYNPLYLYLFNRITDITESLKTACKSGDELSRDRAVLGATAALTKAQSDAADMYLAQNGQWNNFTEFTV